MNNVYHLEHSQTPEENPPEGTRRLIDGEERVLYDGYWIKTYEVPADTLEAKKRLIEALTRRLFNHTEHGLNIPGTRLAEARASHEAETDPAKKRVKAAMLAGALFNRATDIFRKLVELQSCGIEIRSDDALMRECGQCLLSAMELGHCVRHRSGDEGIDELWGEPFRAFSIPLEDFYESRYIKIGQSLRDIDKIANAMIACFAQIPVFAGIEAPIRDFTKAAQAENRDSAHRRRHFRSLVRTGNRRRAPRQLHAARPGRRQQAPAQHHRRPATAAQRPRPGVLHHPRPHADAKKHPRTYRTLRNLPRHRPRAADAGAATGLRCSEGKASRTGIGAYRSARGIRAGLRP